jgi:hypothetical protein
MQRFYASAIENTSRAAVTCILPKEVRTMGVEPIPPFGERILSPLRLPFRHVRFRHEKSQNYACCGHSMPENDI